MPMFIKGVKGGRERGTPVEYTPSEKVEPALKLAVTQHPEWQEFAVYVTDTKVKAMNFTPNGDPIRKRWQNNRYTAEGTATFNFRHKAKDKLFAPRTATFRLEFCDCADENGLPALKIEKFSVD